MTPAMRRYIDLNAQLADSTDERLDEKLTDEMDRIWYALTDEERKYLDGRDSV